MICLDSIGHALNIKSVLIELDRIRHLIVCGGRVRIRSAMGRTEVPPDVHPAVDLDIRLLQPIPCLLPYMAVVNGYEVAFGYPIHTVPPMGQTLNGYGGLETGIG